MMIYLPEMAIATDCMDARIVPQSRRWSMKFIHDFITFGALIFILVASPKLFRSARFVESIVLSSLVALVLHTRSPFWRSRPSMALILAITVAAITLAFTLFGQIFGLLPLPLVF